jgi:hypothetical protein
MVQLGIMLMNTPTKDSIGYPEQSLLGKRKNSTLIERSSSDEEVKVQDDEDSSQEKISLRPRRKIKTSSYASEDEPAVIKKKGNSDKSVKKKPELMNLRLVWPSHIKFPDGSLNREWFEDRQFLVNIPVVIQDTYVPEDSIVLADVFDALNRAEDQRPYDFEGFDRDAFRFIGTILSSTSESF